MPSRPIRKPEDIDALWFPVIGYEGRLEITRCGRIRRCAKIVRSRYNSSRQLPQMELSPFLYNRGYPTIQIRTDKKRKNLLVHRLLAEAFIPNPEGKPYVNHIDGNKANNDLSNLEWVTHAENIQHAFRTGLAKVRHIGPGEKSPSSKLTWEKVGQIRAMLASGRTQQSVAEEFGVRQGTVGFIARNETWRVES